MTLHDLILAMFDNERLMVRYGYESHWLECTPDELTNLYIDLLNERVATLQRSSMYDAIMIELE